MAEINGKLGTSSFKLVEVLNTVGNFPYLQTTMEGPETTSVADVIAIEPGDLLKIASSKVARYVAGDSEDIIGVASDYYDSTALNAAGSPAGTIDMYIFGHIRIDAAYRISSGGVREAIAFADIVKARKMGLHIN